jgi:hypothetical protein
VRFTNNAGRLLLALALVSTRAAIAAGPANPEILITTARAPQPWQVVYTLPSPASQLIFPRTPDDSRRATWQPDDGFEIIAGRDGDTARRKDGASFKSARFRMNAEYRVLPDDYAPFEPFGDGGMLFHTGRFFACVTTCADDATWSIQIVAGSNDRVLVDGRVDTGRASWSDRGDGRVIYIGANEPVQAPEVVTVLDGKLPPSIRVQLSNDLPAFMRDYAARLGKLSERPTLFVSYDQAKQSGWGRQGGVLPGQVFVHFYGDHWPTEMTKPDFPLDLAWHFAHEGAHLYQRMMFVDGPASWIHEGAAEAFAVLQLRLRSPKSAAFVQARIDKATEQCTTQLRDRSLHDAIASGQSDLAYACGLLINLRIHSELREAGQRDGLYALWRNYLQRGKQAAGETAYLSSISALGCPRLAFTTRALVGDPRPVLGVEARVGCRD